MDNGMIPPSPPNIFNPEDDVSPTLTAVIQVFSGLLVLLLQLGLQLVEAGSIRSKNTSTVFMRGLACLTISVVISWVCGYSFSFSSGHYLLGFDSSWFGLHSVRDSAQAHWFLHAAVASLPSAIIAASMSERSHLTGHLVIAIIIAGVVYPLPAHWVWHQEGWLYMKGCRDVGGVIMVHVIGGVGALVGSLLIGPRVERLGGNYKDNVVPGHSLPLAAVGGMMVILGMVGKVVGLTSKYNQVGQLAANSLIGGAGGGVVAMTLFKMIIKKTVKYNMSQGMPDKHMAMANRRWSYLTAYNGFLTGMICVSGVGPSLPTWAAFISGLVGGVAFFMLAVLLRINKVDDPVSGVAVNLSGGVVGAMVTGLANLVVTHDGMVLGWQLVGVVVVSAWVVICCLVIMLPLLLCGKLRIKDSQEKLGVDFVKVLEQAYSYPAEVEGTAMSRPMFGEVQHLHPGVSSGIERERSPVCAFVTPNIRDQQFATHFASTCKVNPVHLSQWSMDMDTKTTAPRIVLERPSPAASLHSLVPAPPPYLSTEASLTETSLTVPDISVNASSTGSQDNSRTPLLSTTGPSSQTLAVDVKELRAALKQQKERLKATNSLLRTPSTKRGGLDEDGGNELNLSVGSGMSDNSVKSEVVRQVVKSASNKDNFNYLAGTRKLDDDGLVDTTEVDLSRTVEVVEETGKGEKDFDYSKKDIDDGLAQVTYLEVSNVNITDNELSIDFDSDDEGEDENVKESGPI